MSRGVCELMDWRAANDNLKQVACRKAFLVLDRNGIIKLPQTHGSYGFEQASKQQNSFAFNVGDAACDLAELGTIEIELINSRYSNASKIWKTLMDAHHYLGSGPLCGGQIRYLVHSSLYGYLGALAFNSAAWALKARDEFIVWTVAARRFNLQRLVCNSRFLIVPTVHVPNLASHVLGQCMGRIAGDWMARYAIKPVALESFVDLERFSATSYRATNWISVGHTSGRRAAQREQGGGPKEIFFYPLCKDWRQILCEQPKIGLCQRPRTCDAADWVEEEFNTAEFYDPRLKRRLFSTVHDFYNQPQAPIPQACGSQAKTKGAYRFFDNQKVTMDNTLRGHVESSVERIKTYDVVVAVQDTTSLNYTTHRAAEGLGPINNSENSAIGLLLHDTMAFTEQGTPLGLLDVQCWARDPEDSGKKYRRKELPIEQKESMKWLNSYRAISEIQKLCPDTMLVSVGDREADIYELFLEATKNPHGPKLLVRCERSRKRKTEAENLWAEMDSQPVSGIQIVQVPKKGNRRAREAKLEVHYKKVSLKPPQGKTYDPVEVWMVYAKEVDYPAIIKSPLEWMLLTTVETSDFEQACQRLDWYTRRWGIEVFHRTFKSGCKTEDRRLGTADSLQVCVAIDMVVAWRIHHLTQLGRQTPESPCSIYFEEAEWKALHIFVNKNPNLPDKEPTLQQAIYMLASLGGFLGRKGDGQPGTTALWRGLQRLHDITNTYLLLLPHLKSGP